jgi:DNA primase
VPRAVATCGTALTEEHLRLLQRFAKRIVLAFDADAAGQGAAERFYEWERRLGLDVAVARLPDGIDPGDLAERDPAALRTAVEEAMPFLGFRVERALAAGHLGTPEGRARTAQAALAVIGEHPDPLVRDQYLMQVADRCRLEPDQLRTQLRGGGGAPPERRERRTERAHPSPEVEALVLLVHRRDEMLAWLDDVLFTDDRHVAVLRALVGQPDVRIAIEALHDDDPGAAETLARIAVVDTDSEPDDVGARLVALATERVMRTIEAEARVADDPLSYSASLRDLKLDAERLRDPVERSEAAERLLPLLRSRGEDGNGR